MSNYHVSCKVLSRSKGSTVANLAYRSATELECALTGKKEDYTEKGVEHVEILLPENAPLWARDLQKLCLEDKGAALQTLSDIAEAAEKRSDAQVYREIEYSLPVELTLEQRVKLANELVQDQCCKRGMLAVQNFHFSYNSKTGAPNPHCHTVLLTRELVEEGLSSVKNRDWNRREYVQEFRAQLAAYTNFHLQMHGFETRVDHRSYKERGIDLEPQPKLRQAVIEMEGRGGRNPRSIEGKLVTDKGISYQAVKLRNLYRIIDRLEIVLEVVSRSQATFVWGDIEKVLVRYVDDLSLYGRLTEKLRSSPELVCLKEGVKSSETVYTTREVLKLETELVQMAGELSEKKIHGVAVESVERAVGKANAVLEKKYHGALSSDQVASVKHLSQEGQLVCIEGYAGSGKTTLMRTMREIWSESGYRLYGIAPTGKAAGNLSESGIESQTIHKFLKDYKAGRNQLGSKSVVVLDEAGMVDLRHFHGILSAAQTLGFKLVLCGDQGQLPAVVAGVPFRLITNRIGRSELTTVLRQEKIWQQEATRLFGEGRTREALSLYERQGHFVRVEERVPDLEVLKASQDYKGVVGLYNLSKRLSGRMFYEMRSELGEGEKLSSHPDYGRFKQWQEIRKASAGFMKDTLEHSKHFMTSLGVDGIAFAKEFSASSGEAQRLSKQWGLTSPGLHEKSHICDTRPETKKALVQDWYKSVKEHPGVSHIMMALSNSDVQDLNAQARHLLKGDGTLGKEEYVYQVERTVGEDLGKPVKVKEDRYLSCGDQILFTRNDRGLGVKNGTVGVVEELSKSNIKVRIDGDIGEGRVVSFAPKLFSHFDNGWACTIHKEQGATVDRSFVLGSFELYKNLSYVALSRHRKDVKVYNSSLDFWRPEKVLDRLSRSSEKLSSLDYVDEETSKALLSQEDRQLQSAFDRLGDRIGNRIDALGYVGKRVIGGVRDRLLGLSRTEDKIVVDPSNSLSEAERAKDLFEKPSASLSEPPSSASVLAVETFPQKERKSLSPYEFKRFIKDVKEGVDVENVALSLMDRTQALNTSLSRIGELRFGKKGSLVVYTEGDRKGDWYSYERGQGGDLFQLVQERRGTDFKETLSYLTGYCRAPVSSRIEEFLKGQNIDKIPSMDPSQKKERSAQEATHETQRQLVRQEREAQKIESIEALYAQTISIKGTVAETYLRKERGIQGALPKSLRYIPVGTSFLYEGKERFIKGGALASLARDGEGRLKAIQVTYLASLGERAKNAQGEKFQKITYGVPIGSSVEIQKGNGPIYLAEGVETALSLKEAGVKGAIHCSLGISNLKNLELKGKEVVIAADWDGSKETPSWKAIQGAKEALESKGNTVHIVLPCQEHDVQNRKIDFNDVLIKEGVRSIRSLLKEQIPGIEFEKSQSILRENKQKNHGQAHQNATVQQDKASSAGTQQTTNSQKAQDLSVQKDSQKTQDSLKDHTSTKTENIKQAVDILVKLFEDYRKENYGSEFLEKWDAFEERAVQLSKEYKDLSKHFGKGHKETADAVQLCIDGNKMMERGRGR